MRSKHSFPPRALALTGEATVISSGRIWVSLLTGSVGAVLTADLASLASTMQYAHFHPRPRLLQPRGLLSNTCCCQTPVCPGSWHRPHAPMS